MSININHEWDEGGNCAIELTENPPCWKFSLWDIAGIFFGTAGGVLISIGTGLGYVNRECQAAAQYTREMHDFQRERFDQEVARAEMAGTLEGMFLFDEPRPSQDFLEDES